MKKILLTLLLTSIPQLSLAYNEKSLINFYKEAYREQMAIGFFKKYHQIKNPSQRKSIIDYMKKNNYESQGLEIETAWQDFIKSNFKNPLELNKIIENNYIDLDRAKNKFIEDLDLEKYFNLVVVDRLKSDLKKRDEGLEARELELTDIELIEAREQIKAIYGNKLELDKEDIEFLIKTSL